MTFENIRQEILVLVKKYAELKYADKVFIPGESVIPPSGKVIGIKELQNMVEASLDGWFICRSAREDQACSA